MHKFLVFFVLFGLLLPKLCRSQATLQLKNLPSDSCSRKTENIYEELHIRKTNAQLATAIAAAAQYFAQQQSPESALPAPPADLVSLALACQQPQNGYHRIAEDWLAYGFTKIPVENPCYHSQVRQAAKVPEEASLYTINGEVMELKKTERKSLSLDQVFRPPTLSDLGYVPAQGDNLEPN